MLSRSLCALILGAATALSSSVLAQNSRTSLFEVLKPLADAAREVPLGNSGRSWDSYVAQLGAGAGASYREMQERALDRLAAQLRPDTCSIRRERLAGKLADALRYIEHSHAIYASNRLAASGATDDPARRIFQDPYGHHSELHLDHATHEAILVFRGTQSRDDMMTNVGHFLGIEMPYYVWAADVANSVRAEYPGWNLVATGHSLGGALAMWAAIQVEGFEAVAFNPAGLSFKVWDTLDPYDQARATEQVSAFVAVTPTAVDPVSAMPIAGLTAIPGRVYAVPVDDQGDPQVRHSLPPLKTAMSSLYSSGAAGEGCDYDVGFIALPAM